MKNACSSEFPAYLIQNDFSYIRMDDGNIATIFRDRKLGVEMESKTFDFTKRQESVQQKRVNTNFEMRYQNRVFSEGQDHKPQRLLNNSNFLEMHNKADNIKLKLLKNSLGLKLQNQIT